MVDAFGEPGPLQGRPTGVEGVRGGCSPGRSNRDAQDEASTCKPRSALAAGQTTQSNGSGIARVTAACKAGSFVASTRSTDSSSISYVRVLSWSWSRAAAGMAIGFACGGLPTSCRRPGHFPLLAQEKVTTEMVAMPKRRAPG